MAGDTHERLISQLAAALAGLRHVDAMSARLCEAGRRILSADGAAITLSTPGGARVQASATDDLAAQLEDLQDVVAQGPTLEAMRTGTVLVRGFDAEEDNWSLWHEHGARLGFHGTVVAVPLLVDTEVIGALSAHRRGPENPDDREIGEFLGVALATALLQDPELGLDRYAISADWSSRAQIHQATGMIVAQIGVLPGDALALLKGQASARNISLLDVAQQIVQRQIDFRQFTIEGD
jgi:hypothetical protein